MKIKTYAIFPGLFFFLLLATDGKAQLTLDRVIPVESLASKSVIPAGSLWESRPSNLRPVKASVFTPEAPTLPDLYSFHMLAPFCKLDVILEESVKVPVKFRLGDQRTVDRLERKGHGRNGY